MVSSELPEILGMSDRIMVIGGGRVRGFLTREEANEERIMELATAADRLKLKPKLDDEAGIIMSQTATTAAKHHPGASAIPSRS